MNIKVPGTLWVVLIALSIWAIESFAPAAYQMYAEVAVVAIMAVVKGFNLDDKQVQELLDILRRLQAQVPAQEAAFVQPDIEAHKPDKLTTWLWG